MGLEECGQGGWAPGSLLFFKIQKSYLQVQKKYEKILDVDNDVSYNYNHAKNQFEILYIRGYRIPTFFYLSLIFWFETEFPFLLVK
jgi:hypothetical protein